MNARQLPQRATDGQRETHAEPQTALSKRERDETPDAQDSWSDAVAAKRLASEAETQPTQAPDEARAPASPPEPKTERNRRAKPTAYVVLARAARLRRGPGGAAAAGDAEH